MIKCHFIKTLLLLDNILHTWDFFNLDLWWVLQGKGVVVDSSLYPLIILLNLIFDNFVSDELFIHFHWLIKLSLYLLYNLFHSLSVLNWNDLTVVTWWLFWVDAIHWVVFQSFFVFSNTVFSIVICLGCVICSGVSARSCC